MPELRPDLIEERRDEHRQRLAQEVTMAAVRFCERLAAMPDARTLGQPYLPKIFGSANATKSEATLAADLGESDVWDRLVLEGFLAL